MEHGCCGWRLSFYWCTSLNARHKTESFVSSNTKWHHLLWQIVYVCIFCSLINNEYYGILWTANNTKFIHWNFTFSAQTHWWKLNDVLFDVRHFDVLKVITRISSYFNIRTEKLQNNSWWIFILNYILNTHTHT